MGDLSGALPGWDTVVWTCFYGMIGLVGCVIFLRRLIAHPPDRAEQQGESINHAEKR